MDDVELNGYLEGDGDFRSTEVTALRDQCDIVITNPPFSLFREFVAWIEEGKKSFIIMGNKSAISNKEFFPLLMENKVWVGYTSLNGGRWMIMPKDIDIQSDKAKADGKGNMILNVAGVCWFTNLEHGKKHESLTLDTMAHNLKFNNLLKKYHSIIGTTSYPKYDNYDAIEVKFVECIPSDYDGIMGVPVTFMNVYNPEQFEILGCTQRGCHDLVPDTKKYDNYIEVSNKTGNPTGSSGSKTNENGNLTMNDGKNNYFINSEGHIVQSTYSRIFIRRKGQK